MLRRLRGNVVLRHPDDGSRHVFLAGTTPPPWAAEIIVNPKAWEGIITANGGYVGGPAQLMGGNEGTEAIIPLPVTLPALERPPLAGTGSGLDQWLAYANAVGVKVAEDAKRADVIAAVDAKR
jgi:hypothetical protein